MSDFQVGDTVVFYSAGKQGMVRYMGETEFAEGIWYGVELTKGVGKHNGTVDGVQYFKSKPGKGVLVTKNEIKYRLGRKPPKKRASGVYGNANDIYADRVSIHTRKASKKDIKVPRKAGPRDVGRNKGYKGTKLNKEDKADTNFLEERKSKTAGRKAPAKAGPREIGRNKSYEAPDYELKQRSDDFLAERSSGKRKSDAAYSYGVGKKFGPRDEKPPQDFVAPDYPEAEAQMRSGDFLSEKPRHSITKKKSTDWADDVVPRKPGPVETGKNKDFHAPDYPEDNSDDFLAYKKSFVPARDRWTHDMDGLTIDDEPLEEGAEDAEDGGTTPQPSSTSPPKGHVDEDGDAWV